MNIPPVSSFNLLTTPYPAKMVKGATPAMKWRPKNKIRIYFTYISIHIISVYIFLQNCFQSVSPIIRKYLRNVAQIAAGAKAAAT